MTAAAQWINETFANFDYSILEFFHNLHEGAAGSFFDVFFNFITVLGDGGIFLIILSIILMFFKKTRRAGMGMLFGVAIGALFTNITIKNLVARPRPYHDELSIFHQWWIDAGSHVESEYSFPSGHTTSAMGAMTGLFFTTNKKYSWLAFFFVILMGMSRVFLCVHFPSDILGGIVTGFVTGFIGALIVNAIYKHDDHKINKAVIDFDIINIFKKKA